MGVRWLKVRSKRNSYCSMGLKTMEWDNWWVDGLSAGRTASLYLHMRRVDEGEETWWRVYCKHTDKPRLGMRKGQLYWLIDK